MKLRELLKKHKMTQTQLARQLGLHKQQVHVWCRENSPYNPSQKYQEKIKEILGEECI